MKKIVLLLTVIIAMVSCDKADDVKKQTWDPMATITIRPAKGVKVRSTFSGLTAMEIVERGASLHFQSHYFGNVYEETAKELARGFNESMKDYSIPALKMLAIDVISAEGEYYRDLTYATSVFITDSNIDTIAYIPDHVISSARVLIEQAFNSGDYDEVYRLFNEAFTFLPIE